MEQHALGESMRQPTDQEIFSVQSQFEADMLRREYPEWYAPSNAQARERNINRLATEYGLNVPIWPLVVMLGVFAGIAVWGMVKLIGG